MEERTLRLVPVHDQLIVLGDLNATSAVDGTGFKTVVGLFGYVAINDNSVYLLSLCLSFGLTVRGSWFKRRMIHRWTWISNDKRTVQEIDTS